MVAASATFCLVLHAPTEPEANIAQTAGRERRPASSLTNLHQSFFPSINHLINQSITQTVVLGTQQDNMQHSAHSALMLTGMTPARHAPDKPCVYVQDPCFRVLSTRQQMHFSAISSLAYDPKEKQLISASRDGLVLIWDEWSRVIQK